MEISYDKYSLMVDGKRVFIKSGAFHYFRTPGVSIARDRFNKLKAGGYNTVDIYFNWNYHSKKQGVYDFSGIKDVANATGTENTKIIKRLRPDEITDEYVYDLSGEQYALKDAVSFTDGVIEKLTDKFFNGHTPMLANIAIVFFPETNEYSYILRYYHSIDGLFFDDVSDANPDLDYLYGCYLDVEIRSKEKIFNISNYSYQQISDKKELSKMIPLSEAEKTLADVLAYKAEYTITECELKYVCITYMENNNPQYRPMWAFTLKEKNSERYVYAGENFDKIGFYIDAVTGDYYYVDGGCIYKNGDDRHALGENREHEKNYEDY